MKNYTLLIILLCSHSVLFGQTNYYNFSDTTFNHTFLYRDTIIDPYNEWSIQEDTVTGQHWLEYKTDTTISTIHKSSCILQGLNGEPFTSYSFNHQFNFNMNVNGYLEDSSNMLPWLDRWKIIGNLTFGSSLWQSGSPSVDNTFKFGDSLNSVYYLPCYAMKTELLNNYFLKFTVEDTNSIKQISSWKVFNLTENGPTRVCSGIKETEFGYEFSVYPNPTEKQIQIELNDAISPNSELKVSNPCGIVLYKSTIDYKKSIDISSFQEGVYFLSITDKNSGHVYKRKIYKQ